MNKKVRIISGTMGGLSINTPKGHRTHPMSEKMRSAMFNSLGDITDLTVLDLYSGSGAIGIEALSRGAKHCTFVENDQFAVSCLRSNIKALQVSSSSTLQASSVNSYLITNSVKEFDIVIADPPYDKINSNDLQKILESFFNTAIIIFSLPADFDLAFFKHTPPIKTKTYGNAQLIYFKA